MSTQEEKALALSLVRKHILEDKSQLSYVQSYTTIRWVGRNANACQIGGHWRRKALCSRSLAAIQGTCRLQELYYDRDKTMSRISPPSRDDTDARPFKVVKRAFRGVQ